jgi:cytochrome b involved in lipid metabolism
VLLLCCAASLVVLGHGIQNGEIKVWRKSEVSKHNSPEDLFIIVQNKVYDVSDYVEDHPGGAAAIVRYPGQDCTEQFSGIQHPAKVWDVVQDYYVGELEPKEHTVYTFKTVSKL